MALRENKVHLLLALVLASETAADLETVARIRMEGFQRSQVMEVLFYLSDVYGPRLHSSKNFDEAALWSRDRLREWGMDSSEIESWPSPVPGWSLDGFSLELLEPSYQRLLGYPMAWTPDPIEYSSFTHHTNMDVYDHVREEDLKQAAVVVASVAYLTAMRHEKLPRKPRSAAGKSP